MLRTRLTQLLGIEHPVLCAGMAGSSNVDLTVAVSEAGGLGILGASGSSPDRLREQVAQIRSRTDRPFGVNFLLYSPDASVKRERVHAALEARVPLLSTAWGSIAEVEEIARAATAAGVPLMHMVQTSVDAAAAARAGAAIIVAQGGEGGGHVGEVSSMPIIPASVDAIARALPDVSEARRPPVVAAGGIADGRGLAAALALGAEGIIMGTRFLVTPEANVADGAKAAICAASEADTVSNTIRDAIASRDFFKAGALCRVIRNPAIERWLGRDAEVEAMTPEQRAAVRETWAEALRAGRFDETPILAGQDCGLIHEILPAAEIVRRTVAEAEAILSRLPSFVA
jgi:NAD(P)H-dependent flavin oxidoreductase YrpB (nitropropane dioxygenase family)